MTRIEGVVVVAAIRYAAAGYDVFPCITGSKRPRVKWGTEATSETERIRAWWTDTPDANVAIATGARSGVVVIDLDGETGAEAFKDLQRRHGTITESAWVRTRKGWHAYFRHPGTEIRNSASKLGAGIDVRGDGGYVIAPPSVVDGHQYRWWSDTAQDLSGSEYSEPEDLRAPSRWLVRLLQPPRAMPRDPAPVVVGTTYASAALRREVSSVAQAVAGTRNHTLNVAAFSLGQLVATGQLDEVDTIAALEHAAAACGLGERESRTTIRSGLRAGREHPREVRPAP